MSYSKRIANKIRSSRSGEFVLSVLAALGLTKVAQAQASDGYLLEGLEGVAEFEVLPDETLRIVLENGDVLSLPSQAFELINGQVVLNEAGLLTLQAATGASAATISAVGIGAAVAGGAGAIAVASSSSSESPPPPPPPPTPDAPPADTVAPEITSPSEVSVAERTSIDEVVYQINATDANTAAEDLTYSLSGADADKFVFDAEAGTLKFAAVPDFEDAADADGENTYNVTVTVSDGTNEVSQDVEIGVTDVDEVAPEITSGASVSVPEGTSTDEVIYQITTTDANTAAEDLTYSLSGADADKFVFDAEAGTLKFAAVPDFEDAADADTDNTYNVTVTVSDGTNQVSQDIEIGVTDVDEVAPVITSDASVLVPEGTSTDEVIYQITATDANTTAEDLTYSLSGADADKFVFDAEAGTLKLAAVPDFEDAADADTDNTYNVTVTVSDGTNSTRQDVTISITDVDEIAPVITSVSAVSVPERTPADEVIYQITATDANTATEGLTYGLAGPDAEQFTIDPATGEVRFASAPDHERPADAGTNNVYNVTVTVTDGLNEAQKDLSIAVTDLSDSGPTWTSETSIKVDENQTDTGYIAVADPDIAGTPITYSILGEVNNRIFSIDPDTGALSFKSAPDYDAMVANGEPTQFNVLLQADDGTNQNVTLVQVELLDIVDIKPQFTSSRTVNVAENETDTGYRAQATPDIENDPVTYSIVGGEHADLFEIDPATGALSFKDAPDHDLEAFPALGVGLAVYGLASGMVSDVIGPSYTDIVFDRDDGRRFEPGEFAFEDEDNGIAYYYRGSALIDGQSLLVFEIRIPEVFAYALTVPFGVDFDAITWPETFSDADINPEPYGPRNTYEVMVQADDGTLQNTQTVTVNVTDPNVYSFTVIASDGIKTKSQTVTVVIKLPAEETGNEAPAATSLNLEETEADPENSAPPPDTNEILDDFEQAALMLELDMADGLHGDL